MSAEQEQEQRSNQEKILRNQLTTLRHHEELNAAAALACVNYLSTYLENLSSNGVSIPDVHRDPVVQSFRTAIGHLEIERVILVANLPILREQITDLQGQRNQPEHEPEPPAYSGPQETDRTLDRIIPPSGGVQGS